MDFLELQSVADEIFYEPVGVVDRGFCPYRHNEELARGIGRRFGGAADLNVNGFV